MNGVSKDLTHQQKTGQSFRINIGKNYLNISTRNGGGNYNITIYRTIIDEILIRNSLNANLNPACQFNYESLKSNSCVVNEELTKYA